MAYNGYSGLGYNGYYGSPQVNMPTPAPVPTSQAQNNPMTWVQGETGAKSYLLAPNTTIPLWDSEAQTIYLKSADASGMPSMKILDYTIRESAQPQLKNNVVEQPQMREDYVTHKELKDFEDKIIQEINDLKKEELGA